MQVTYITCHDEFGEYLDKTKRLDEDINVGYMIHWSKIEGYENWEVTRILKKEEELVEISTGKVKRIIIHVTVKKHPYIKTHCVHEWGVSQIQAVLTIISPDICPEYKRTCIKCNKKESFNYGTGAWV